MKPFSKYIFPFTKTGDFLNLNSSFTICKIFGTTHLVCIFSSVAETFFYRHIVNKKSNSFEPDTKFNQKSISLYLSMR